MLTQFDDAREADIFEKEDTTFYEIHFFFFFLWLRTFYEILRLMHYQKVRH